MKVEPNLKKAIDNNNLVIFVGAGLSTRFSLPSWKKLATDIIRELDDSSLTPFISLLDDGILEPIEVLEKLKKNHNEIRRYIKNNFEIKEGDISLHKNLIDLSGRIVTTNYDNAFELASDNMIHPTVSTSNFNVSQIIKDDKEFIFKIHGSYQEPDNCLVFKDDYERIYKENSSVQEKLKSIFTNKVILFLGFGFNDHEINKLFNTLDQIFDNNNEHFILTLNKDVFREYKFLKPITINSYSEIDDYVSALLEHKTESSSSSFIPTPPDIKCMDDHILSNLENNLTDALTLFEGHKPIWIDPVLSNTNKISSNYVDNYNVRIEIDDLIDCTESIFIKSPPQFGLTCLARYLVVQAWNKGQTWVYLDSSKVKRNNVEKFVLKNLKDTFGVDKVERIDCIVLDGWKISLHGGKKLLTNLSQQFPEKKIVVLETINENQFLTESEKESINRDFEVFHLLALPKILIRKLVSSYNDVNRIGEEDKLLNKIVLDLGVLNIHRTPMNCLTLLKVCEKYFDERTINRADMLHKVLFILFDLNNVSSYNTVPDVKDCEFVLGSFCEMLIRKDKYTFAKKEFTEFAEKICSKNYIDLDIQLLFQILHSNGVLIELLNEYHFRSTYWMFYFAANRMYVDPDFCDFIFSSGKYVNYPEIIEFYTGIDRRRTDALKILSNDLQKTNEDVFKKLGMPMHVDPYQTFNWNPTPESLKEGRSQIGESIKSSNLPTEIKDQHSEIGEDQMKPYDQGINTILAEYSLAILFQKIRASSRALRNSDYAEPELKKRILGEIINGYEQVAKAIMILTPELAMHGRANYEGQGFNLSGDFGDNTGTRMNRILINIPWNISNMFKDDIDSDKVGPLLFDKFNSEKISIVKHFIAVLIIKIRPRNWRKPIENYMNFLPKNSFYLFDLVRQLHHLYFYDYTSEIELGELKHLLHRGYGKHHLGTNTPSSQGRKKINEILLKKPKTDDLLE